MWKWMGLFLRKNHLLRCWGWLSLPDWIRAFTLSVLLKLPLTKLELWFVLWSFFLLRLLCISINPHAWNTVVMSGLALLFPAWNCWISYKNGYEGLFVLHFLPLWNPWLIVEMFPAYNFFIGFTLIAVNLNWLNWFHFFILEEGLIFILIACMTCLLPFPYATKMSMSTVSFLAQLNSGIICL